MAMTNRRIVLAARPDGVLGIHHFRLESVTIPELRVGEVLVRNQFLSLDPYMRGRMSAQKSYAPTQTVGEPMIGGTVGSVVRSRHPDFQPGDPVLALGGWQEFAIVRPDEPLPAGVALETGPAMLTRLPKASVPHAAFLGPAGMPGVTAWYSVNVICSPRAGETLVVSAAAGAVGGIVGQLAKRRGCRVVGIAGGAEKCRYVTDSLGFDACVDYKAHRDPESLGAALRMSAPDGIDAYHDNVGGAVLNAVLAQMNPAGRVAVCGVISRFSGDPIALTDLAIVLRSRLLIRGFIIMEQPQIWERARQELVADIRDGVLSYRESVAHGLERAPDAFIGMMAGTNVGKQLVKIY